MKCYILDEILYIQFFMQYFIEQLTTFCFAKFQPTLLSTDKLCYYVSSSNNAGMLIGWPVFIGFGKY